MMSAKESAFPANVQEVMLKFVNQTLEKGPDVLLKEYAELKRISLTAKQVERTAFDRNPTKNRYKDIPCVEKSRIILRFPDTASLKDDDPRNYVHANLIDDIPGIPKITDQKNDLKVITTQGPVADTVEDFWRMVWQEKMMTVVMLCGVREDGKKKCEQYYPAKMGLSMSFLKGDLSITNMGYQKVGKDNLLFSTFTMTYHRKKYNETKSRVAEVVSKNHALTHIYWDGWPDKSVPLTASSVLRLLHHLQKYNRIVFHCSAGVGRTGAITAVFAGIKVLTSAKELNMFELVRQLRTKRFLACQTDLQYLYIHLAIMYYIASKHVFPVTKLKDFQAAYQTIVSERLASGKE